MFRQIVNIQKVGAVMKVFLSRDIRNDRFQACADYNLICCKCLIADFNGMFIQNYSLSMGNIKIIFLEFAVQKWGHVCNAFPFQLHQIGPADIEITVFSNALKVFCQCLDFIGRIKQCL